MLFMTSCNKEQITPITSPNVSENVIANRTNQVTVNATVNPQGTDLENGIIVFTDFDADVSGLTIASTQQLDFIHSSGVTVTVQVDVVSFEIIILDGVLESTAPGTDFNDFEVSTDQSLVFE